MMHTGKPGIHQPKMHFRHVNVQSLFNFQLMVPAICPEESGVY